MNRFGCPNAQFTPRKRIFDLSLTVSKNDKMVQMVDKPNATPIGQGRETLTFKTLLYLNVAVNAQVCRLFCVGYIPLLYLPTPIRFPIGGERVTCRGLKLANSLGRIKLTVSLVASHLMLQIFQLGSAWLPRYKEYFCC